MEFSVLKGYYIAICYCMTTLLYIFFSTTYYHRILRFCDILCIYSIAGRHVPCFFLNTSGGKYDRKLQRYLVNLGAQGSSTSGGNKHLGSVIGRE